MEISEQTYQNFQSTVTCIGSSGTRWKNFSKAFWLFGTDLPEDQKRALIQYLKSL
jgi:hypothetical protein